MISCAMVSPGEKNVDKCLEAQIEEIEVLCSIYGDEWKTNNAAERSYSIEVKQSNISVMLYVTLPPNYPFDSPPTYTLSAPDLKREQKTHLNDQLQEVYLQNIGQTVLFQWIQKIKEYLEKLQANSECFLPEETSALEVIQEGQKLIQMPEIVHGEIISDRKSIFQGHVAVVHTVQEVRLVINELKKNRKIANATHNMYAFRLNHNKNSFIKDCDDDGETNAGSRLLHLLEILKISSVVVVVSRWYGGIHLGADRFRHINNAAKQALEVAGLIENKNKV